MVPLLHSQTSRPVVSATNQSTVSSPAVVPCPPPIYHQKPSTSGTQSFSTPTTHEQLDILVGVFPNTPLDQLKFLLDLRDGNADVVSDLFIDGLMLSRLVGVLKSALINSGDVRRLTVDGENPDVLAESAVTFYKGRRFNQHAEVRISICNQPAVDTGGVRRLFFFIFVNLKFSAAV